MTDLEILRGIAFSCLNVPYIWGGQNPLEGMDCSGFCLHLLKSLGLWKDGDTTAQGIYNFLSKKANRVEPQEGAFLFFGKSSFEIMHIAYAIDDKRMIEAHGDRTCLNVDLAKVWRNHEGAFIRVSPINKRIDLVAALKWPFL